MANRPTADHSANFGEDGPDPVTQSSPLFRPAGPGFFQEEEVD